MDYQKMITVVKIPIKCPSFSYLESINNVPNSKDKLEQIKKLTSDYEKTHPNDPWTVKRWKNCLSVLMIEIAKHFNGRVCDLVYAIEKEDKRNVQQSFGYKVPEGQLDSKLPPSIKQGIGAKLKSNTADLYKYEKRPPFSSATWISINRPKSEPFVFTKINDKYIVKDIDLPKFTFQEYSKKDGKITRYVVLGSVNKGKYPDHKKPFILDLHSRMKDKNWNVEGTYENNIKKLVSGQINSNCAEIIKKDDRYYIHFVIEIPTKEINLIENKICGLDIGQRNPISLACGNETFSIASDEFWHIEKTKYRIKKIKQRSCGYSRCGHGKSNKLKSVTNHTNRNQERTKKWVERISKKAFNWILHSKASVIQMEDLSLLSIESKKEIKFPYRAIQTQIEYLANRNGVVVKYVNPAYTSQRCSKCGEINSDYTFEFRTNKKNFINGRPPGYICHCGFGTKIYVDGDKNAAINLSTENIDNLIANKLTPEFADI